MHEFNRENDDDNDDDEEEEEKKEGEKNIKHKAGKCIKNKTLVEEFKAY